MNFIKKDNGLTLVELLATVVILGIVSILIFSFMVNGINQSESQKEKANLQQQANYVLTVWKEYHEDGIEYEISISNNNQTIKFISSTNQTIIEKSSMKYYLEIQNSLETNNLSAMKVVPHSQKRLKIRINVESGKDPTKKYDIKTTLSRL